MRSEDYTFKTAAEECRKVGRCINHNVANDRCFLPTDHEGRCRFLAHVCDETCLSRIADVMGEGS